jgi:hypothetical protein
MTRELKAAIEDLKEGINLMSEAIITIVTEVAKVIDEEDIDIDSEEDLEGFVERFLETPEEDLPELEEIPDENPVNSRETLIIEDEDIRAWD